MSVSSYDERYIKLLADGGTRGVELKMTKSEAVALRHRLYRLRDAMRKEQHELTETADRASISIRFSYDPQSEEDWVGYSTDKQLNRILGERGWELKHLRWVLRISPPDQRFDQILAEAGYTSEEPPPL